MFENLQKIHTEPGTVATFDNYRKKCCKTQHFRPKQVQKIRGLGVAPGGGKPYCLLLLLLVLLVLLLPLLPLLLVLLLLLSPEARLCYCL